MTTQCVGMWIVINPEEVDTISVCGYGECILSNDAHGFTDSKHIIEAKIPRKLRLILTRKLAATSGGSLYGH